MDFIDYCQQHGLLFLGKVCIVNLRVAFIEFNKKSKKRRIINFQSFNGFISPCPECVWK
jgi:hypothetical protein